MTLSHPKMDFCVCSGFLTQELPSSVSVPVPALPAGMGDNSTMMTETLLQGEQGISHGDIPARLWLVALQGISCGDMPGILWLLPFQPPQTSSHLTAQSAAPSLCLLWEGPGTNSSDWVTSQPRGTQEPWPFSQSIPMSGHGKFVMFYLNPTALIPFVITWGTSVP